MCGTDPLFITGPSNLLEPRDPQTIFRETTTDGKGLNEFYFFTTVGQKLHMYCSEFHQCLIHFDSGHQWSLLPLQLSGTLKLKTIQIVRHFPSVMD